MNRSSIRRQLPPSSGITDIGVFQNFTDLPTEFQLAILEQLAQDFFAGPDLLAAISRHTDTRLRLIVAEHPNTPENVLVEMANFDVLPEIRETAWENLQSRQYWPVM
jgi:hypothetical protein